MSNLKVGKSRVCDDEAPAAHFGSSDFASQRLIADSGLNMERYVAVLDFARRSRHRVHPSIREQEKFVLADVGMVCFGGRSRGHIPRWPNAKSVSRQARTKIR
jgi:hypothetical protein